VNNRDAAAPALPITGRHILLVVLQRLRKHLKD
jgi:hypothetical protein